MSVLIPDNLQLEPLNSMYYTIDDFRIADIFTKNFIDGYALSGDLCLASTNENCQLLICNKKITLRLDRELYYSLHAVHLNQFLRKSQCDDFNEIFEVDLTAPNIHKIREELASDIVNKVAIHFSWKPQSSDICSSSCAKFLSDMGYAVKESENQSLLKPCYGLKLPKIPHEELNDNSYDNWSSLIETASMAMIGLNSDEISVTSTSKSVKIKRTNVQHYKGFIPNFTVKDLFDEVHKVLNENHSIPYVAISLIPYSKLRQSRSKLLFVTANSIYASE